jgi:hypothetical protein
MYTYPLPANVTGFVALVTISDSPNSGGSAQYRTVGTYIVSMTTGNAGTPNEIRDYLDFSPIYRPVVGDGTSATTPQIVNVCFGRTATGSSWRVAPFPRNADYFTIVWTSNKPGTPITVPNITIQPLHVFAY